MTTLTHLATAVAQVKDRLASENEQLNTDKVAILARIEERRLDTLKIVEEHAERMRTQVTGAFKEIAEFVAHSMQERHDAVSAAMVDGPAAVLKIAAE